MTSRQQYLVFSELCNECGNCMTFCPEHGDPAIVKPRLYTDRSVYEGREGQGFLIEAGHVVAARATDAERALVEQLLTAEAGLPLASGAGTPHQD